MIPNPIQILIRTVRKRKEKQHPVVHLQPERMATTRILPSREDLIAILPKNGIVAEVGVDMGDFSRKILDIAQPEVLHLVDLWPPSLIRQDRFTAVSDRFAEEIRNQSVVLHRGDSEKTMADFPDQSFDWIYLDTTHIYDKTVRELAICAKKVKPGGWLCGHDYTVGSWIEGVRFGVVEAVNQFCNENGWDLVYLTNERHRYISYALQKKS
ncbi:MAG: class I SAM-dependent methyltransferase [Saprospiraceae bacterium]